jgi:hypothetical protein
MRSKYSYVDYSEMKIVGNVVAVAYLRALSRYSSKDAKGDTKTLKQSMLALDQNGVKSNFKSDALTIEIIMLRSSGS